MKPHAEMIEGPEAFERLRNAMKTILSVPKSALPPSPYRQSKARNKRPAAHAAILWRMPASPLTFGQMRTARTNGVPMKNILNRVPLVYVHDGSITVDN